MLLQSACNRIEVAIQITTAILKQKGELSIDDIKAIPSLSNPHEAADVIDYLISQLHAEVYQKKVRSQPIAHWEQFVRIKKANLTK